MESTVLILLALILVFINGFFVAAEFAIVKLRGTRLHALKRVYKFQGHFLDIIHHNLDNYLSACQLGITLTSLGLGWIGEPAVARLLKPVLDSMGIFSPTTITVTSFTVAFVMISFVHIVVGELVPKNLAIRKTEIISLWIAIPLYIFNLIMYPAIWLLNMCARGIMYLFGFGRIESVERISYSPEEFKLILSSGPLQAAFRSEEVEILKHVLEFSDLTVGDILRPMEEMVALPMNNSMQENMNMIAKHRFSRYPVYEDTLDNIIGLVHVKDLLVSLQRVPLEKIKLKDIIRPVIVVQQDYLAYDLFTRFKTGPIHFAVIKNKTDNAIGFITLDNILMSLLGNIRDEFNKMKPEWLVTESGALMMKGNTPIYTLERALNIEIITPANTLAGLIMTKLERMPKPKERIEFSEFDIVVHKIEGPKIMTVVIYPRETDSQARPDADVNKEEK